MLEWMPHTREHWGSTNWTQRVKKEEGEDMKLGGGHTGEPRRSMSGNRYDQNILHRGMKFSRKNIILKNKIKHVSKHINKYTFILSQFKKPSTCLKKTTKELGVASVGKGACRVALRTSLAATLKARHGHACL